jgi:small-conductance mechanosensitive channel
MALVLALSTLAEQLDALLVEVAPLRLLLWFVLVGVIVWALAVGVPLAARIAWQLGLGSRRRLAIASSAGRILAPIVALLGAVEPFFKHAPGLTLIGLLTVLALAMLASPSSARNLVAGLGLALRARPQPDDLVRIGELEGIVVGVGLMRVGLHTREGGVTLVPAADFERLPVTIGSDRAAVPVEIEVQPDRASDEAELERIRRALWFSPFRRAGSEVRMISDPVSGRLRVAIDTWAPRASVELERHVRELLRRSHELPRTSEISDDDEARTKEEAT